MDAGHGPHCPHASPGFFSRREGSMGSCQLRAPPLLPHPLCLGPAGLQGRCVGGRVAPAATLTKTRAQTACLALSRGLTPACSCLRPEAERSGAVCPTRRPWAHNEGAARSSSPCHWAEALGWHRARRGRTSQPLSRHSTPAGLQQRASALLGLRLRVSSVMAIGNHTPYPTTSSTPRGRA